MVPCIGNGPGIRSPAPGNAVQYEHGLTWLRWRAWPERMGVMLGIVVVMATSLGGIVGSRWVAGIHVPLSVASLKPGGLVVLGLRVHRGSDSGETQFKYKAAGSQTTTQR